MNSTPPWMRQARCIGMDSKLFFARHGAPPQDGSIYSLAREICHRCPVRLQCLEDAMDRNEHWGMWGGKSPHERRQLRALRESRTTRSSNQSS